MLYAETHQIKAGSQFGGQQPSTDYSDEHGGIVYTPDTQGGLLELPCNIVDDEPEDPETAGRIRRVTGVRIAFGTQDSWSLKITDGTNDYAWLSGTNDASLLSTDLVVLLPNEKLKLVTANATLAMRVTITYELVVTV